MATTVLVFSDTHLTHRPDPRKLGFLLEILRQADTVAINGDFWDSCLTDIERFVGAPAWQPLFQTLKEKEAVYLYGNHDPADACQGGENAFSSSQRSIYRFTQAGRQFQLEHGDRIAPDIDAAYAALPRFVHAIGSRADNLGTRLGGQRFLRRYRAVNERMRTWQSQNLDPGSYLVCGHSHYAELSKVPRYANSGSIRGRIGSYLLIQGGEVRLRVSHY